MVAKRTHRIPLLVAERLKGGSGEEAEGALHEELLLRRRRHLDGGSRAFKGVKILLERLKDKPVSNRLSISIGLSPLEGDVSEEGDVLCPGVTHSSHTLPAGAFLVVVSGGAGGGG